MRGKWSRSNDIFNIEDNKDNTSSTSTKYVTEETHHTPKMLRHTPSLKAMNTYNNMPINGIFENVDTSTVGSNYTSLNLRIYDESSIARDSLDSDGKSLTNSGDYATIGTFSISGSELNPIDYNEMGSTIKLMSPKVQQSWQTWSPYMTTTICSTCMAAGLGNLYRLPQTTIIRGGLPFLTVYLGLTVCLGIPLLFLELGIGQLAQEGVIKSWRAVPFFKGIGYAKLLMCSILSVYYPLYIGLSLFYVIWMLKETIPFQECFSGVKITDTGYSTNGKDGQTCLKTTFLKNPFEDPYWFGIFAIFLLVIWVVITIMSVWKTKGYIRSLLLLLLPVMVGYFFVLSKSIIMQNDEPFLHKFVKEANWSLLNSANIWYYASIQVFFSTSIGFGNFATNAGVIYNKVNPFWTAFSYIVMNTLFGFGSVVLSQTLTNDTFNHSYPINELHLMTAIYDIAIYNGNNEIKIWAVVFYCVILMSGFISMASHIYTLLKAVTVQSKNRWKWWYITFLVNFTGFLLGCLALLLPNFDAVHLLDHYIVGNLVIVVTVFEISALISFYGVNRIKTDFEFMVGHILSRIWLILWWLIPLFLTATFACAMITLPLEGTSRRDPPWLYGTGWGVVLSITFSIFVVGYFVVMKQDGYTFQDKFKASVKPTNNWGPKDPISRLNWIQWSSKAQQGEKDFTLKRKGTRDYTRSVKRNKKIQNQTPSELTGADVPGIYTQKNKMSSLDHPIYSEVPEHLVSNQRLDNISLPQSIITTPPIRKDKINILEMNSYNENNFRITSLPNTLNLYTPSPLVEPMNPLSQTNKNTSKYDDHNSLRKGPYIISDDEVDHICFRKHSVNNDVSEL